MHKQPNVTHNSRLSRTSHCTSSSYKLAIPLAVAYAMMPVSLGGCESSTGSYFLSEIFGQNARQVGNTRSAQGWQTLSNVARFHAQNQSDQEVRSTPQTVIIRE